MAIHGILIYRFPIILEEKNLRRIIKDLSPEHCDYVTYSGTIASGAAISFPSADKLFEYENSDFTRLVSLTVRGFRNRKTTLSITFDGMHGIGTAIKYREVCICEYEAPSEDVAERLKGSIEHFVNTSKPKYWWIGKYGQIILQAISTIFVLCSFICRPLPFQCFERMNPAVFLLLSALLYGVIWLFLRLVQWLMEKMFPPVVFLWNEEKKRSEYRKNNITSIGVNLMCCFVYALLVEAVVYLFCTLFS